MVEVPLRIIIAKKALGVSAGTSHEDLASMKKCPMHAFDVLGVVSCLMKRVGFSCTVLLFDHPILPL